MSLSDKQYLQVNQALFTLAHAYESRMAREKRRNSLGLAISDCSTLMVLGQFAPVNFRQLSGLMDINPGTISVYVQRLIEKNLVQKEQDQKDRRNWWLNLTRDGLTLYREIVAGAVEYTSDFLTVLDEEEQDILLRLLQKVSHSLGFDWQ